MIVYQLRRVLVSILKHSLYGQLHSNLFLGTQCLYAWEVTLVSNSIPGNQVSICVGGGRAIFFNINVDKMLESCIFLLS